MNFISKFDPKQIGATAGRELRFDLSPFKVCCVCSSKLFPVFPQVAGASNRCRR